VAQRAFAEISVGTYFRLVHEPNSEAKRQAFGQALAKLKSMERMG